MRRPSSLFIIALGLLAGCAHFPSLILQTPSEPPRWVMSDIVDNDTLSGTHFSLLDDGMLAIVGVSNDTSFVLGSNSLGEVKWYSRADTALSNLYSSHFTRQGSIVVVGDYPSEISGVQEPYMLSLNRDGGVNWQTRYESKEDMSIYAVTELSDRSLVVGGASFPQGSNDNFDALADSFIMKTTALGEVQWIKRLRLPQDDQVNDLVHLPDDSLVALINNFDEDGRNLGMRIVRIDATGKLIYSEKLRLAGVIEGASLAVDQQRRRLWIAGSQSLSGEGEADEIIRSVLIEMDFSARILGYLYDEQQAEAAAIDLAIAPNGDLHVLGVMQKANSVDDTDILYRQLTRSGVEQKREIFGADGADIGQNLLLLPDGRAVILATFNAADVPQMTLISEKK